MTPLRQAIADVLEKGSVIEGGVCYLRGQPLLDALCAAVEPLLAAVRTAERERVTDCYVAVLAADAEGSRGDMAGWLGDFGERWRLACAEADATKDPTR